MHNISLFVEDRAHEDFLTALIQRLADEYNVKINIKASSVRGGHGKVITELRQYLRDLQHYKEDLPDLVIVGTDGNREGFSERKKAIDQVTSNFTDLIICAIPDPHIERWLLLDSAAFKTVLGKGCQAPDQKFEKDRYKKLLIEAVLDAGLIPILGGIEHAADIVNAMDFQRVAQNDRSFRRFFRALQQRFEIWQQTEG